MSSETAGILGNTAGNIAGSAAAYSGVGYGGASAISYGIQGATALIVTVMAKHEATELQRQIAEERAKAYLAGLNEGQRKAIKKKRYIAVDTKRDSKSTGQKSVMVFDTTNDRLVGNEVLDIKKAPETGSTARFDTVDATYVGS